MSDRSTAGHAAGCPELRGRQRHRVRRPPARRLPLPQRAHRSRSRCPSRPRCRRSWECRCGAEALRENDERPSEKPVKPARTHWDMLLERRSIAELEELLEERLELLRSGDIGAAAPDRPTRRTRAPLPRRRPMRRPSPGASRGPVPPAPGRACVVPSACLDGRPDDVARDRASVRRSARALGVVHQASGRRRRPRGRSGAGAPAKPSQQRGAADGRVERQDEEQARRRR